MSAELNWFKSSHSDSSSGNDCVEVAHTLGAVHVRDSKNPHGLRFNVGGPAWTVFTAYASTGPVPRRA